MLLASALLACLPRHAAHPRAVEQVQRGYRHLAEGDAERAEVAFAHALAFDPDLPEAENGLGVVARTRGDLAEARRRFGRALGLRADFAEGHANLGELLLAQEEPAAAEAELGEALRIDPDLADARQNLARSLLRRGLAAGAERPALLARARREVLHLLEAEPDRAAAHHDLGFLEYVDGRFARAERSYRRAAELSPGRTRRSTACASRWSGWAVAPRRRAPASAAWRSPPGPTPAGRVCAAPAPAPGPATAGPRPSPHEKRAGPAGPARRMRRCAGQFFWPARSCLPYA